ncbi:uncharacterized protein L3040_001813 [Drepanopeziza brunnea f. sp. 'multigermtubi']|nr:hypothetical protein L3040_001813 [Drepanopeziza brunnea f. sp. 'multigermtubi']
MASPTSPSSSPLYTMDTSSSILVLLLCSLMVIQFGRNNFWGPAILCLIYLMGSSVSPREWGSLYLALMFVWGWVDHFVNKYYSSRYQPAPIQKNPKYTPNDVSVVVRTLKPPVVFPQCLKLWLDNNPLEILICTTKDYLHEVENLVHETLIGRDDRAKVRVIVSEKGGRKQLLAGVMAAEGRIIATSDNHIKWPAKYLIHMLPCFEDDKVAAAGPSIKVEIPAHRHDSITPWEVAAVKLAARGPGSGKAMYAAAKWCWILAGTTGVYRASVLQTPEFAQEYLNDYWCGVNLDVGEDTFISRWILKQDLTIAIQWMNETDVTRTVKRTGSDFWQQLLRWERSTLQSFCRTILHVPQFQNHFLVKFRTYERVLKFPLTLFHLIAWPFSLYQHAWATLLLLAYYVFYKVRDYQAFVASHPHMRKHALAAVLMDFSPLVVGGWALATLSDNSWDVGDGRARVAAGEVVAK